MILKENYFLLQFCNYTYTPTNQNEWKTWNFNRDIVFITSNMFLLGLLAKIISFPPSSTAGFMLELLNKYSKLPFF